MKSYFIDTGIYVFLCILFENFLLIQYSLSRKNNKKREKYVRRRHGDQKRISAVADSVRDCRFGKNMKNLESI